MISKSQADFRTFRPQIGSGKDHGLWNGRQQNNSVQRHAAKNSDGVTWGAGDCIQGDYAPEDQLPSKDLGVSSSKNVSTEVRAFGCPTVRDDVGKPKRRSIADNQNYGADTSAADLLRPSQYSNIDIDDSDFLKQRQPEEIRDIFENIGIKVMNDRTRQFLCVCL